MTRKTYYISFNSSQLLLWDVLMNESSRSGEFSSITVLPMFCHCGTGKLMTLLLVAGTSSCNRSPPPNRWDFPTPYPWPHKLYSTSVTNELVRTLVLSDKTPPRLPGLKPSSNSVLPIAWITKPATVSRS